MKKKITIRFVSVVLCLAMMFACLQVSATALTLEDVEQVFDKLAHYTVDDLPKNLRRHLNSGWSRATLDKADADNENVLTTVNADGTKTLYSYDSPIKFVDEEGYVRFIDSSLKPCVKADGLFDWYSYENTANDIKTYFPLFIKTGVLIEGEQGDIRMTPKDARNSLSSKVDEGNNEYVLYEDVFDKGVDIRYTAINEGVKEDIILEAYNGDNTFEYIVEAEGLTPVRNEGKTVEFIDGDMQTAYTLGEIVMFDSAEVPATNGNNSYTVEELKDGKYLVTLVIDEEFLTDENTVYPVIVDPTVGEDTAVNCFEHETYAFGEDEGEGIQLFSYIGVSETEYEFITYMQLTDMSEFVDINPSNVNSASFKIYSNNATPSYNVELFACNFDDEVAVDELTQSYIQYAIDNKRFTNTQTITNLLTVDISDYFVDWLTVKTKSYKWEDTLCAEDGFFIKAAGSDYSSYPLKPLYMQYVNDDILAPSITVNYTEDVSLDTGYYYIQSGYYYDDARYLTARDNGSTVIYDYTGAANQIWYVARNDEYTGNSNLYGRYRIYNVGAMDYIYSGSSSVELDHIYNDGLFYDSGFTYKILDQSNGYKRIIPGTNGYTKTLGVKSYLKENNSPIVLQDVKGLDNQRWKFKPVEKLAIPVGDDTKHMVVGERLYLSYNLINGAQLVSLSSSNNNVVSLEDGYLVANSQGTATITAVASITTGEGTLQRSTRWTVHVDSQSVTISEPTLELNVGDVHFLEANTEPFGLSVTWSSENDDIATVNPQTGKVTAIDVGVVQITATIPTGESAKCEVNVYSTDPFHPSNVQYARYTRITGKNYWGLGDSTDHTISVLKSNIYSYDYYIAHDNINGGYSREYAITADLKDTLNNLEAEYQEHYNIIPGFDTTTNAERAAHSAKLETDQLVESGYFTNNSSEYYGTWAYNYASTLNIANIWQGVIDTATAAYGVYLTITSCYYSYLSSTSTTSTSLSSTQYKNMSSYLDDIDDAMNGVGFSNKTVISSEERNLILKEQGYTNPYQSGTPVVQFNQNSTTQYVRVYTSGTTAPAGKWIMKYSDIQGLTPAQIQSKFALPNTPTHYCFVNVPTGTQMYAGIVGENYGYTAGQAVQFELGTNIPTESFGAGISLP